MNPLQQCSFSGGAFLRVMLAFLLLGLGGGAAWASDTLTEMRQAWQLLDYIAVDYGAAVNDGQIIEAGEYAEMQEFATTVLEKLQATSATAQNNTFIISAQRLNQEIVERASPVTVAKTAHELAAALIAAYPISLPPATAPKPAAAATLYAEQCAGCHGLTGAGDGPLAAALDPPPIAFSDAQRAAQRSVLSLYQVIFQGLDGTAMGSYAQLSEDQRWALAFYVGGLAFDAPAQEQGKTLWNTASQWREAIPDLQTLTRTSEQDLGESLGVLQANAVLAYLRSHPEAVVQTTTGGDSFALARNKLGESLEAYRAGDAKRAKTIALMSYLDGVEPYEAMLATQDRALMRQIETAMLQYRAGIDQGVSWDQLQRQARSIEDLFGQAEDVLAGSTMDPTAAFLGSFTVLLREGLEALLIVVGIIAFLSKAGRREAMPYVHAGWLSALLCGGFTWAVATHVVAISGASREVTEGLSALFAAVVLLSVGLWMHQKSMAGRWQAYLQQKVSAALTRRSAWFLFLLAFVAVYREVFETILFLIAMWSAHNGSALLAGIAAASGVLAVIAYVMLRISKQLPLGQFFSISALLIAVLALVLTGKGIAALQEAGWIGQTLVAVPRIDWLGIYPSAQTLLAQLGVLLIAIIGYFLNSRFSQVSAELGVQK